MKKRLLASLAAAAALASPAFAIPAKFISTTASTLDGEQLEVTLQGNEDAHWYEATDGRRFMLGSDGVLTPYSIRPSKARSMRLPGRVPDNNFPCTGNQRGIAILVEYQDVKFTVDNPKDYFTRLLNEEGYSEHYATGSARDWYVANSQGKFTPTFDVYGPVTLQNRRAYYGGNDAFNQDTNPQKMVIEACRQLNPDVDFSPYDGDGDGKLDNVFIFYAGKGEASSSETEAVWPHAWYVSIAEPDIKYIFDEKQLDRYACANELEISDVEGRGICPAGIGTFVHEFNHVLGLPDLYTTNGSNAPKTMWHWSVMHYGPYLNEGHTPPMFSSYERSALGWGEPEELPTASCNLSLAPIGDGGSGYKITLSENESYVIENRQLVGWDAYLPNHGLIAWHINYNPLTWAANTPNNDPYNQGVELVPADNWVNYDKNREKGLPGAPFPGTTGRTSLTLNGIRLTDITETNMPHDPLRMAFRVNGGAADIAAPQQLQTVGKPECDHVSLAWEPVQGAKGYVVSMAATPAQNAPALNGADPQSTVSHFFTTDTQFETSQLTPNTFYHATVIADDGVFGSLTSEEQTFTTPAPSLKYLTPEIAVSDVTSTSFSATFAVPDLDLSTYAQPAGYELSLGEATPGEPVLFTLDFTDGLEALPDGWTTTATGIYGMATYAGESAPSLRFSASGQKIESPLMERPIEKVTFWARGNGTENGIIAIFPQDAAGTTLATVTKELVNDKGRTYEAELPENTRKLTVAFSADKGSAAFDDLTLHMTGDEVSVPVQGYPVTANEPSYTFQGLNHSTDYRLNAVAINPDGMRSLVGTVLVTTLEQASLSTLEAAYQEITEWYDLQGRRIPKPTAPGIYLAKPLGKLVIIR